MKFPQILTIAIIAIVLAVIGFLTAGMFQADPNTVAASSFIGALLAPLINTFLSKASSTNNSNDVTTTDNVKTLYVGNLPYRANESSVRELFSEQGTVHSVRLMKDKHTGKRRGFGFVEMSADDADNAVSALNDTEFQQRTLKVREAKDRPERTDENI
ncbi:MAG: RNA-binding protein [Alteromonadaceae bacterium]|nr:RNA-binding protein [Alteromonadaceae bacterium]